MRAKKIITIVVFVIIWSNILAKIVAAIMKLSYNNDSKQDRIINPFSIKSRLPTSNLPTLAHNPISRAFNS
jgi:hypothetical protein